MIILGIDPGLATVGYGVIKVSGTNFQTLAYGTVSTKAGLPLEERLLQIHTGICELINRFSPDEMAIEELFFNTNITTGITVAEARGVILLAARQNNLPYGEYTPLQVKQSVVGYGRAEKKQVITMVTMMLGLEKPPKPDDAADALALAVCHAHCSQSKIKDYFNQKI
ncbi:MAG: crossover junction endodeoxyribonuclease RuvC [Clostridia bacterium]|nr:crossover junction endodeoxyribonuclease RuvC [Clostridia bacterium]